MKPRNYCRNRAHRDARRCLIWRAFREGRTHSAIARELGIDRTTVTYYLNTRRGKK